jgi:hypothetical protein
LIGLLLYANKTSFSVTLADRKRYYSNDRKRAKDVVTASGYYYQAEKALHKSFWLQSWKLSYEEEKSL